MDASEQNVLQPGTIFGRYRIVRTVGVGSFGIVYEAWQSPLNKRVALKVLHPRTLAQPQALARFEREALAAARMKHPHVVEVFDMGRHDGTTYLAMEFLEGENLSTRMRRDGTIPLHQLADIFLPMISAVAAVHDAGIVHRDLKPDNFILTRHPSGAVHPKLLDFGIAKLDTPDVELTRTNALLGTPCYMSPEQIMQSRSTDARSDQWALGVILYEAATGKKPFYSDVLLNLMNAITSTDAPRPRAINPAIPQAFENVVLRAMRRMPDERFATVRDLGRALHPFATPAAQSHWMPEFGPAELPMTGPTDPRLDDPFAQEDEDFLNEPTQMVAVASGETELTPDERDLLQPPLQDRTDANMASASYSGQRPAGVAPVSTAAPRVMQAAEPMYPAPTPERPRTMPMPPVRSPFAQAAPVLPNTQPQHYGQPPHLSQIPGPPPAAHFPPTQALQQFPDTIAAPRMPQPSAPVGTGTLAMDVQDLNLPSFSQPDDLRTATVVGQPSIPFAPHPSGMWQGGGMAPPGPINTMNLIGTETARPPTPSSMPTMRPKPNFTLIAALCALGITGFSLGAWRLASGRTHDSNTTLAAPQAPNAPRTTTTQPTLTNPTPPPPTNNLPVALGADAQAPVAQPLNAVTDAGAALNPAQTLAVATETPDAGAPNARGRNHPPRTRPDPVATQQRGARTIPRTTAAQQPRTTPPRTTTPTRTTTPRTTTPTRTNPRPRGNVRPPNF
jgi:serine/threonine-protein kinase